MEYKKLNQLCEINIGKTPSRSKSEYWGKGYKWVSISDLKSKFIDLTKEEITDIAIDKCNMKLVPKNTVVMSFKLSIGKTAILKEDMFTNEAIANFPIKDYSKITAQYLYYALQTLNFSNTDRAVMGATLNKSKLNAIEIPYFDINYQNKIIAILDKAQELIDKRKEQIEGLDELVKSKFIEMFGSPSNNPNKFDIVTFEKIIEYMVDIGSNGSNAVISANLKMTDTEDYALMVRTLNFTANDFENNVKYVSKDVYEFFKKSKIYGGELIFNKIGSAGINFVMPYLNRPVTLGLNQIMVRINAKVNITYLYILLNSEYGKYQINRRVQGAVTKSITKGAIKEIPIMLPPIELQNQFADFVKQVYKLKFEMKKSLKEMEDNYKSLMQKAFNGELFK
ncbi:MAG: restriction endonuclease subunit S [Clostridium sp.]|uniref:restriction endonuclease subunit S n=1 Tax=Clostridium sp. TaxID=1506 RepID=UPI002FC60839